MSVRSDLTIEYSKIERVMNISITMLAVYWRFLTGIGTALSFS
jgi:hypothetical protein